MGGMFARFDSCPRGKRRQAYQELSLKLTSRGRADGFQPGISILRRAKLYKRDYIDGAPDLITEAPSPSNKEYDRAVKLSKYRDAGAREYWMTDPADHSPRVIIWDEYPSAWTSTVQPAQSVRRYWKTA
jgi:Uma2 family endonuclease